MRLDKTIDDWCQSHPLIAPLSRLEPLCWFNPALLPAAQALADVPLGIAEVDDASARLERFAPFIASAFAQTRASHGIIESPLLPLVNLHAELCAEQHLPVQGSLWLKADNLLPISGSIKARGGIYEVLKHAEDLALAHGLLSPDDNYAKLDSDAARAFFGGYSVAVGSTGNLGLSIGIISARLGFKASVHMSADARQWKKDLLRSHGVDVIEYASDYSVAVEQGRQQAKADPRCHFVDDENSRNLFLGYAVAARRLQRQLGEAGIVVDAEHPLFVYLPCGVGGGPGGVAFGLKQIFADAVHCLFAEPTHSPCMLLGVYSGLHDGISVYDIGIDNRTAADGLAVGRPSGFVGRSLQRLLDGFYTVDDDTLFRHLAQLEASEGFKLEPSAVAGVPGFLHVRQEQQGYRQRLGLDEPRLSRATHIVWGTGGSMVPEVEMNAYLEQGRALAERPC
ncbi:D-serine ammonia-lyase [Pseudomonas sp. SDI]|uniref:D-serine ammonia-lyase n=1 Tax=Pseudomonas sp. SDI TaxID=2170734 RepID=UPI000DE654DF|nr:D-serine ammonia-lyase [Pseudomonas sp. SDI]PWB31407.1 D-serine ammonia-lyase [Pseudomonas sp. SDI]